MLGCSTTNPARTCASYPALSGAGSIRVRVAIDAPPPFRGTPHLTASLPTWAASRLDTVIGRQHTEPDLSVTARTDNRHQPVLDTSCTVPLVSPYGRPRLAAEATAEMPWLAEVVASAADQVDPARAEGLVWGSSEPPEALGELLDRWQQIRWVQLPWAGVESYLPVIRAHPGRSWTCGKGAYARPVAELALALAVGCLRRVPQYARADAWARLGAVGHLSGANVTIVGGGGIASELIRLLGPFDVRITVVRRSGAALPGAHHVRTPTDLLSALAGATAVVSALPSTPATVGIFDRTALDAIGPSGVLVNVGRGTHIVTADLVDALAEGSLGGAALDVTDPEPLPPGHPLWTLPTCVITPHIANDDLTTRPLLAARIVANIERFAGNEPLLGLIDPAAGY